MREFKHRNSQERCHGRLETGLLAELCRQQLDGWQCRQAGFRKPGNWRASAEFALADADFFGSVLLLLQTKSEDEVINIAKSTEYRLSAEPSPQISTPRTAPPTVSAPTRSSSMNGLPAGWKPPSVAMANQAIAARRAAKRCGTTCRPKNRLSHQVVSNLGLILAAEKR